jgi:hypothetical protein
MLQVVRQLPFGGVPVRVAHKGKTRQGAVAAWGEEHQTVVPLAPSFADALMGIEQREGQTAVL